MPVFQVLTSRHTSVLLPRFFYPLLFPFCVIYMGFSPGVKSKSTAFCLEHNTFVPLLGAVHLQQWYTRKRAAHQTCHLFEKEPFIWLEETEAKRAWFFPVPPAMQLREWRQGKDKAVPPAHRLCPWKSLLHLGPCLRLLTKHGNMGFKEWQ